MQLEAQKAGRQRRFPRRPLGPPIEHLQVRYHTGSQGSDSARPGPGLVYIATMPTREPAQDRQPGLLRQLAPLLAVVVLAAAAYYFFGRDLTLEALVRHRVAIDAFVTQHYVLAVLAYVAIYIAAVALSVPGAWFLTVSGGFLFGLPVGAAAAALGATIGATIIFLVARSTLGEVLLKRAGPRAAKLAEGFRDDAFSYLLFLRLVPAFPFFLVNLVPAFAGVKLLPFVAATALGVIPGSLVFSFAGIGLDSVIAGQRISHEACLAAGRVDCQLTFDAGDILTPHLIAALIALGVLALAPVVVRRLRVRKGKLG